MNLLNTLNDPNVQKFLIPLASGMIAIVSGWAVNQLPPLQNVNQGWRVLKVAIESAIAVVMLASFADAMKAMGESDTKAQLAGIAYAIVLLFLLIAVAMDIWKLARKQPTIGADLEAARKRDRRAALMENVRNKWIESVLENPNSLYQRSRIELGLEKCLELERHLERRQGEIWRSLSLETRIFDEFTRLGEGATLLILGEPGGGKTTLLLELARDLLAVTDARDSEQSLPVVLNLSSWGTSPRKDSVRRSSGESATTFKDWLIEELYVNYQVRREVGVALLKEEKLVLLLDGLDEVRQDLRNECVAAMNQFQLDHGAIEIVVCSRIKDYQALSSRLTRFREAVYILPLNVGQVDGYLQQAGVQLDGFREAMRQDEELQALVSKPLFLSIAALAYQHRSADELVGLTEKARLRILFNRYVDQMFVQREMGKKERRQMIGWLSIVAQRMGTKKEFRIEQMQPKEWLHQTNLKQRYRLLVGLLTGLLTGLLVSLTLGWIAGLLTGILTGLLSGRTAPLYLSIWRYRSTKLEKFFDFLTPQTNLSKLQLISNFFNGVTFGLIVGTYYGLGSGVLYALNFWLIIFLNKKIRDKVITTNRPNQVIWFLCNSLIFICLVTVITLFFISKLSQPLVLLNDTAILKIFHTVYGEIVAMLSIIAAVVALFVQAFIIGDSIICVQHLALRLVLHRAKIIPWNFVIFFQQAEDRLFVQRTGGSYIFLHRYLQEYFAESGKRGVERL